MIKTALRTPGSARFLVAAGVTRAALGLIALSTILLLTPKFGWAIAGQVAGVIVLSAAVSKLFLTSWADRAGQSPILRLSIPGQSAAIGVFVVSFFVGAPVWVLFILAALLGAVEAPVGAFTRARWISATSDPSIVKTAFSLESVVDEFIFVVGPLVVVALAALFGGGYAGLIVAAALIAGGGYWLLSQKTTDPGPSTGVRQSPFAVLTSKPIICAVMGLFVGLMFGTVDISVVSFFDDGSGETSYGPAGMLLAAWATSSVVSGLLLAKYAHRFHVPDFRLIWVSAVGVAACIAPVAIFGGGQSIWFTVVLVTLSGFFNSPLMIGITHTMQLMAKDGLLTGSLGLVSSAITAGVALGFALGGILVEFFFPGASFGAAATVMLFLVVFVGAARARLWSPEPNACAPKPHMV
jgi:hypothetical protein